MKRVSVAALLLILQWQFAWAAPEVTSSRKANVYAQQLVEGGEFGEAIQFLERALEKFPEDDRLLSLYGQALYESRQIQRAEAAFREALRVNPLNTVAKTYVEVIRETDDATESRERQLFESVAWDKAGDVVVLAVGFFLGSILSGFYRRFNERRFVARSKRLFLVGQYDDFADVLEIQLAESSLRPLRRSLSFMLERKSMEESADILSKYVNSEDNLNTLLRMIKLSEHRKS